MPTFDWDGVMMDPQPTEHEWDHPIVLGVDGDGAPIVAKYSKLTLRVPLLMDCDYWLEYQGQTGTLTVPAPHTVDDFTDYTNVYVRSVTHGVVLKHSGMRGVEMEVHKIEV